MAALPAFARPGVGKAEPGPSLAQAAARSGRFFGAAFRPDQLHGDSDFADQAARECSWLAAEIDMKWDALTPAPWQWNYGPADALLAFAEERGLRVRGHALLWEQSTPKWARRAINDTRDWGVVDRHFAGVLGRYGHLPQWDVVNEPIDTQAPGAVRQTSFARSFGPDYVRRALETARRYAPSSTLMINDYGFDYANPVDEARREAMVALVERLVREGAPLGGVGIQAHLDLGKGAVAQDALAKFLARLAATGVEIVVTELDVKEADFKAPRERRDAEVAATVRDFLAVALDQPAVKGLMTWGLSDRHSWLHERGKPLNRGLPFDAAMQRKPMYWAMSEALANA